MNEISVGAVGAAIIAGLVSVLGLIIGKEQKVSEFRQAWIDDLRKCMVAYVVNINAISDILRLKKAKGEISNEEFLSKYQSLNDASNGIIFRINEEEDTAKKLLESMRKFEELSKDNSRLTPEGIQIIEGDFINASRKLLKFEWKRVKRGEATFVWAKRVVVVSIICMCGILVYVWVFSENAKDRSDGFRYIISNSE